ncbi:unnamed protein product [Camellia sinensis]
MVTGVGPGIGTYIFAFVLPLSLLVVTVFTTSRIADKLDRDFLQEGTFGEFELALLTIVQCAHNPAKYFAK